MKTYREEQTTVKIREKAFCDCCHCEIVDDEWREHVEYLVIACGSVYPDGSDCREGIIIEDLCDDCAKNLIDLGS